MAEGGILEGEEEVTLETPEIPEEEEEEEEAPEEIHRAMTNYRDNNQLYSKETDESRRRLCKNGTYTTGSTDTPPK